MKPRVGVIVNPNAFGVRRCPGLAARMGRLLGGRGQVIETHTQDELARAVARFAEGGVELVASCGGDGTGLAVVTELVRAYGRARLPRLALLRGGTVNTVAANLGVRGRPEQILARLVAQLDGEAPLETTPQELLEVALDGGAPIYGFMFAAAMGARFLAAYAGGKSPGVPRALWLSARTLASSLVSGPLARELFEPVETALTVDGVRAWELGRPRFLICSVVQNLGLGFRVAWQAGTPEASGRLHLIASQLSTSRMALQLPRLLLGKPLLGGPHLDRLARSVDLGFACSQPITVDGELYRAELAQVRAGQQVEIVHV